VNIPFNKNFFAGKELEYIKSAVDKNHLHGDGEFSEKCHAFLKELVKTKLALLTSSCTSALELAALLADIKHGDEVILPSYTFVSTASAFALRGAKLVWCDVREDTLNIDETKIEALITPRTKVVAPMHYAGVICDMAAISKTAEARNLLVIEDAAQGFMSYQDGVHAGTFGDMAALSFHGTKNVVSGEGGALLVNNAAFEERAYILREKGTNRRQFMNGQVDKYTWVDLGGSFLPSEITAAFLLAQLEKAYEITARRIEIWKTYFQALKPLEEAGKIKLNKVPAGNRNNAHIFFFLMPDAAGASAMIKHLKTAGIGACAHYVPLHISPMGQKLAGGVAASLPVTESAATRLVRLPLYPNLTQQEIEYVINKVKEF